MKKYNQDKIFLHIEADKYFNRNRPKENSFILDAIKLLNPLPHHNIFEIGCGSGATLKKLKSKYNSNVSGIDTSKLAIEFAKKKFKLKEVKTDTFLNFKSKKKFDIVIDGGFLYVTPDNLINKTFRKIFRIMKSNSYFIFWDYDTPYNYTNDWKYNNKVKSYKRDYLKLINGLDKRLYLLSKKQFILETKQEVKYYTNKLDFDKIMTVMIFKKISRKSKNK